VDLVIPTVRRFVANVDSDFRSVKSNFRIDKKGRRPMQLEWVTTFLTVADEGSFGAAARILHRSQGRVSGHVHELERHLGVELFDRSVRPVRLTPAGNAYAPHARAIRRQLDAGRQAAVAQHDTPGALMVLGTFPSAGQLFVAPMLAGLRHTNPDVSIELFEASVQGLDLALTKGQAAVAVRPWLPFRPAADVGSAKLWRESVKAVLSPNHRLAAGGGPLPVEELGKEPIVMSGRGLKNAGWAYQLLAEHGLTPEVAFLTDQPQILVGLAASGLGVGLINQLALQTLHTDHVAVREVDPRLHREVGVFWRRACAVPGDPTSLVLRAILCQPVPAGTVDIRRRAEREALLDVLAGDQRAREHQSE